MAYVSSYPYNGLYSGAGYGGIGNYGVNPIITGGGLGYGGTPIVTGGVLSSPVVGSTYNPTVVTGSGYSVVPGVGAISTGLGTPVVTGGINPVLTTGSGLVATTPTVVTGGINPLVSGAGVIANPYTGNAIVSGAGYPTLATGSTVISGAGTPIISGSSIGAPIVTGAGLGVPTVVATNGYGGGFPFWLIILLVLFFLLFLVLIFFAWSGDKSPIPGCVPGGLCGPSYASPIAVASPIAISPTVRVVQPVSGLASTPGVLI